MSQRDEVIAGRYLLLDRIGAGGMGHVWRAHDERLDREVAVKQLHSRSHLGGEPTDVGYQRAMREARITARLHHPHAVPVFDVVEHDEQPCLIMQYFPSRSVAELLAEHGRLPVAEVARIGSEVAAALAAAHTVGIVHRDVKPANVLIAPDGTTKITDFGIAHALGDVSLTTTGLVTGTPAYLSPEVARGRDSSPASDVFSLGSTLYAALEGQPPFGTSENAMALLHVVASGDITPPQHAGPLAPLLLRMLAADPQARPSMDEVARTLALPVDESAGSVTATLVAPAAADDDGPRRGAAVAAGGGASGIDLLWPPTEPQEEQTPQPRDATTAAYPPPEAGREQGAPPRRRRPVLLVLLGLAAAVALALVLPNLGDDPGSDAQPQPSSSGAKAPTSPASSAKATPTDGPSPSSSPTPAASSSPEPTTPAASKPPVSSTPTSAQLAGAVEDYYALLPGDLDAAWDRLTERYQTTTAKSRGTFSDFWGGVDRVRASDVSGRSPGSATATITYEFDDGREFVERTSYELVEDDGVLKIDRSKVLSSVQR